ncbi:glycosyltransferase family 2 protein [Paenibacillus sp. OAS669]|uniref:glycosyltransferase family 2 protein n=1 Tax=Paenibacillus sp. OAS669 TaxID=2663821 RepID=UPI00178A635A|nr:glycosyltransferase family 2 protein [Paenibacillus sp. OAS669]MBE1445669.1 glycosyltransferase involved in cell wall biosynthesis [Paenibacillus sp. OAS669]
MGTTLTILIPAFNEEDNIEKEIYKVRDHLETLDILGWNVLVVNDGSKDRTRDIVAKICEADPRIKLINHEINQGVGAAVYTGLMNSTTDWTFLHPADGQFNIKELNNFLDKTSEAEIIVGYKQEGHKAIHRRILTSINLGLTNVLFRLYLRNVTWVTMYKVSCVQGLTLKMRSPIIFTEILVRAKKANARIVETSTSVWDRQGGKPTAARLFQVIKSLFELFKLRIITWGK